MGQCVLRPAPKHKTGLVTDLVKQPNPRREHFEGKGGGLGKLNQTHDGENDNDVVRANVSKLEGLGSINDIATRGKAAVEASVGEIPPGRGGHLCSNSDYYQPESVPDSISAEGWTAPASVTEASWETECHRS